MAATKLALECPYCQWIFEAVPPDKLHSAYSYEKPMIGSYYGEVVEQKLVCRNPRCKKNYPLLVRATRLLQQNIAHMK
jgi:hypothetical protein